VAGAAIARLEAGGNPWIDQRRERKTGVAMTVTDTLLSRQGLDEGLGAPCGRAGTRGRGLPWCAWLGRASAAGSLVEPRHRYPRIMSSNRLDDFPAEDFEILVFCEACGHRAPLDRSKVPDDLTIQELWLRCASCGSREASIRIVYTGAGGFHHGGGSMGSS